MKTPTLVRDQPVRDAPDITIENAGGLFLFMGQTAAGWAWLAENLGDATRYGHAYVVEHGYAEDVAHGAFVDGLCVA